jgi:hypothetical protein
LEENGSDFASNAIDAILKGSPTCTTVNVENLNRSPNMTFSELVEMERELWYRISVSLIYFLSFKQKLNIKPTSFL